MEADCVVEKDGNSGMLSFSNDYTLTGFYASPISRFLSIAQKGLRDSVVAEGRRSGVYSSSSIWCARYHIFDRSETTTDGGKHVLTYEMRLSDAATNRNKKKRGKQYVTPKQSVIPVYLYYMVYDRPKV